MEYCAVWLQVNEADQMLMSQAEAEEEGKLPEFYEAAYQQCSASTYVELCHNGGPRDGEIFIFNDLQSAESFYVDGFRKFEVHSPQMRRGYGFKAVSLFFEGHLFKTKKAAGMMSARGESALHWVPVAHSRI